MTLQNKITVADVEKTLGPVAAKLAADWPLAGYGRSAQDAGVDRRVR